MDKSFEDFRKEVQKVHASRKSTITNSVGVRQAFLFLQKRKWKDVGKPIKEQQFQHIIRSVNEKLGQLLIENKQLTLPQGMGALEVRLLNNRPRYRDGKLVLPQMINWDATLKLWYEDPEAMKDKVLIRDTMDLAVKVYYNKAGTVFVNKGYYEFLLNRNLRRLLSSMYREGLLDTFIYGTVH